MIFFFSVTICNCRSCVCFFYSPPLNRQILDNENFRRRLRASNYQTATRVSTYMCTMPLCMNDGWCQVQFNLSQFTERVFNTTYVETVRVQVHANCRLRRVYFSDQLYTDQQLPNEYRLQGIKMVREKPKSMLKKKGSGKKSDWIMNDTWSYVMSSVVVPKSTINIHSVLETHFIFCDSTVLRRVNGETKIVVDPDSIILKVLYFKQHRWLDS